MNEAERITASIAAAHRGKPHEIIVVDGGSADDTVQRARDAEATVIRSAPGRARQMNAGAAHVTGNVLLFLRADTLLPSGYMNAMSETLRQPEVEAGAFRFKTDAHFRGKLLLEWAVNFRSRLRQMPYGDQALFLRRAAFEELGGFAGLPIMEDYELVCRLRRCGRVMTVAQNAVTSGRRSQSLGLLRTTMLNWRLIWSYQRGQPPEIVAETYKRVLQR